ncbi:MAG TPA: response regulator [Azospirillum sp.]|nr:response regulator [Azospirillum sp.]
MDPPTPPRPPAGHLKLTGGLDLDPVEPARTVLVVEDNVMMRKLFVRCLEEGGYTVIEAEDPCDVVELMRTSTPGLVVMDMIMPGISGEELIKQIRADSRLASIPVLAVTDPDTRRLADAGFAGHVSKPIKPRDFLATVASCFGSGTARTP